MSEIFLVLLFPLFLFIATQLDKLKMHWGLKWLLYMGLLTLVAKLYIYYVMQ